MSYKVLTVVKEMIRTPIRETAKEKMKFLRHVD